MIYLGEKKVGSIYLGDQKLSKIYLGEKLVWEGYPEGHIIGTATEAGIDIQTSSFCTRGSYEKLVLSCTTDTNKRFDLDTSAYDVGTYSVFFNGNYDIVTIDSFKVRFYTSSIIREIYGCNSLLRADVNGIKLLYTYYSGEVDGGRKIEMQSFLCGCYNLKYIKAGGLEWGKVERIILTFRNLPSLAELDLSGADFDNITIDRTCFSYNFGTVGTVVKVIGCSATTQNKILNALNTNNSGQTWVLNDGVITRTA